MEEVCVRRILRRGVAPGAAGSAPTAAQHAAPHCSSREDWDWTGSDPLTWDSGSTKTSETAMTAGG